MSRPSGAASASGLTGVGLGGGLHGTLLYRPVAWLGIGITGGFDSFGEPSGSRRVTFGVGLLEGRVLLPLGTVDLMIGIGLGYGGYQGEAYSPTAGTDYTFSTHGFALSGLIGLDWFMSRRVALGLRFQVFRVFPSQTCDNLDGYSQCYGIDEYRSLFPEDDPDPGILWSLGLALTVVLTR